MKPGAGYGAIQTASIIRNATREGPALLGLIICFLAATSNTVARQPLYWLNGLSTLLFWALAIRDFPSEEGCRELYRTKLKASGATPASL